VSLKIGHGFNLKKEEKKVESTYQYPPIKDWIIIKIGKDVENQITTYNSSKTNKNVFIMSITLIYKWRPIWIIKLSNNI
jgi:hypothetical protein